MEILDLLSVTVVPLEDSITERGVVSNVLLANTPWDWVWDALLALWGRTRRQQDHPDVFNVRQDNL